METMEVQNRENSKTDVLIIEDFNFNTDLSASETLF